MYKLLGGARTSFKTDITISVNPVPQMVEDCLDAVKQGFDILKVKVGKEGEKDIERICAIRKARGAGRATARGRQPGLGGQRSRAHHPRHGEQGALPGPGGAARPAMDIDGLEHVTRNVETPILADEAVFSPRDAQNIIRRRAADLINIKLMKTGGIWNALKICRMAEENGVECMLGCMLESRLSVGGGGTPGRGGKRSSPAPIWTALPCAPWIPTRVARNSTGRSSA